jgi:phosphate transport system permease protein
MAPAFLFIEKSRRFFAATSVRSVIAATQALWHGRHAVCWIKKQPKLRILVPPYLFPALLLVAGLGGLLGGVRVRGLRQAGLTLAAPLRQYSILAATTAAGVALAGWLLILLLGQHWNSGQQHAMAISIALLAVLSTLRVARPLVAATAWNEKIITTLLLLCASVAVLTTFGIVLSLVFETLRFFQKVPFSDFLFGLKWSPQIALRTDQAGSSSAFGALPLLAGTFLITVIALCVAVPIGLLSAIYTSEYASRRARTLVKPALEVLAGIPTVVYGFFAVSIVAPFIRNIGLTMGLDVSTESALAAGVVMGVMIIPFMSSLADDVIGAVPNHLRYGAMALGATKDEMIRQVVLPAALPGIVGAFLLALSRAIGETMIVVMAAGMSAHLTINPLEAVTTVTVQIVKLLVGDQEFDSPKTLAAFALGLLLFGITLLLNIIALRVVRKYREKYD